MEQLSNSVANQLTYTAVDTDFLVDTFECNQPIIRANSDSALYHANFQSQRPNNTQANNLLGHASSTNISSTNAPSTKATDRHVSLPRLSEHAADKLNKIRAPSQLASRGGLARFVTNNIVHPVEQLIVPAVQQGAHRLLTAPANLASATIKGVGSLVGGKTQERLTGGAKQLNTYADSAATLAVDAGTKMVAPKNLVQAACLTAGSYYGSPMSGMALLSAVQAAQGEKIDTAVIASNAVQAYSTGVTERISKSLGAGMIGAIVSGAATGAISASTTAAAAALTKTEAHTKANDTRKTIISSTLRGAVSAGMEKAVDKHITKDSPTDPFHLAVGRQAMRNGVLGAGNAFTDTAHNQFLESGKIDTHKLLASTGQGLGNSVAKTLKNAAINATKANISSGKTTQKPTTNQTAATECLPAAKAADSQHEKPKDE